MPPHMPGHRLSLGFALTYGSRAHHYGRFYLRMDVLGEYYITVDGGAAPGREEAVSEVRNHFWLSDTLHTRITSFTLEH